MSKPNTAPNRARSRARVVAILSSLLLGLALLVFVPSIAMPAGAQPSRSGGQLSPSYMCWQAVSSPNHGTGNRLNAVAAVSATDVWAVGSAMYDGATRPLVEHLDGGGWSIVSTPTVIGSLNAVAAVSATDVWAVGAYATGGGTSPFVMHWDGTAWSIVPSPSRSSSWSYLDGVAAVSANDVWAVGSHGYGSSGQTLVEHWNGNVWSVVSSPSPGAWSSFLSGVATVSSTDVWAVGGYLDEATGTSRTLIERWDGTAWLVVTSPNVGTGNNDLYAAATVSSTDVWAVVYGVAAVSANDLWAVGYYGTGSPSSTGQTLIEHWDGAAWSVITSPSPSTSFNALYGAVTVAASNDVWAVGSFGDGTPDSTLVEQFLPCASPTSTNTPTRTATGTATPIKTVTPTSCSIQYPDVPFGSAFYQYVHCLACRGIVSGYPDGTFGPSNPVTRGQLSKIVSNSAGYTETFSTNTFEDVLVGSAFFPYVERLYAHGGIQGYACGNPEPCIPPANKPYFRPGANVTRGQTSKIVAIAKGLPAPSSGQQTFEDVAPNSTFWQWIEPLAATGAIGGYPCSGAGEPCNPPNNRPYFRPGANVTRGQSAKIVANTFFPNCSTLRQPAK